MSTLCGEFLASVNEESRQEKVNRIEKKVSYLGQDLKKAEAEGNSDLATKIRNRIRDLNNEMSSLKGKA